MSFVQNFPFFSIILCLLCAVTTFVAGDKWGRRLTIGLLSVSIILQSCVLWFCASNNTSYSYMMGHFPAPWGNEIAAGVIEPLMALLFSVVMLLSVLGGMDRILKDIPDKRRHLYWSMVDLPLMQAMLSALRPGCRLVMIGDADQLPSVGAGNVFGDLIRSGRIPMVALTEVFRQADESYIIRNAHLVNGGVGPDLKTNRGDFFFLCRRVPERMVSTVVELCKTRLPEKMGIAPEDIQVLTPTRKGECGTVYLNRCLQAALNPPGPGKNEKAFGDLIFREGDRVMQTKNNYDVLWEKDDGTMGAGIFNGDVGTVEEIDPSGELMTLRFDDRTVGDTADMLNQLDMAYAITVHKAQGSEYKAVILLAAPAAPGLLVRGVLYTAMTRARELLIIVGDDTFPGQMAENDRRTRRYSGLRRRLKEGGTQA